MKSFKIVFASLMIAALGIVGFSSFKSEAKASVKKFDEVTLIYNGTDWTPGNPASLCSGNGAVCGIKFDDNEVDEVDAKRIALEFTDFSNHANGAEIGTTGVFLYEKN